MARILITGSADGLGRLTAETLQGQGNDVILLARNTDRAAHLRPLTDHGAGIVIGDFADRDAVRTIAAELVEQAPLDAVMHNAGVWSGRDVMPVNIIAPYLLTRASSAPGTAGLPQQRVPLRRPPAPGRCRLARQESGLLR